VAKRRRTAGRAGKNNEAELARTVQQSLLAVPRAQGPTFELVARFAPAEEVAGDFYDLFLFGPELLGFYLGDVQGKGLAAAMYAALVSGIMRGLQKGGSGPGRVLDFLNHRLCLRPIPGKFCALGYAALDLRERKLTYANAGLPYPLLSRGGVVTRIELDGLPIGLFDGVSYSQHEVQLQAGDVVLFFTDGLTDSLENRRVRDGEAVVRRVLESRRAGSAEGLADRLLEQLPRARNRRSAQADDASFLVLRIL